MVDAGNVHKRTTAKRKIQEMSWEEVGWAIDNGYRSIIAAAGSIEQHGPQLPLLTDSIIGSSVVEAICNRTPGLLSGPTIHFGVSGHHMSFPGTISLSSSTFKAVVYEYVESLARHGFTDIFIVPTHGGNFPSIRELTEETKGTIGGARFHGYWNQMDYFGLMLKAAESQGVPLAIAGGHAGEVETSLILALESDLVSMTEAKEGYLGTIDEVAIRKLTEEGIEALTSNGILGDSRPATRENGSAYLQVMADGLAEWVSSVLNGDKHVDTNR
jgi:creatinine amidohydrolase/Fe(II)-dependent formamide hydrolase-like protein